MWEVCTRLTFVPVLIGTIERIIHALFHFNFIIESKLEIEISNLSSARRWAKGERGYYGLKKKRSSLTLAFKNVPQLVVLLWALKKKLNHCGLTMP